MTSDRSIEEPCEVTSLTHGFEAERRGRPLRLGSELFGCLQATGLPLESGSGGQTKYNRVSRGLSKTHWVDAACIGASTPERLHTAEVLPLLIEAVGRGRRKMCNTNELGFPTGHRKRRRRYFGYQTGDLGAT